MGEPLQSSHDVYSITHMPVLIERLSFSQGLSSTNGFFFFLVMLSLVRWWKTQRKDSAKILNRHEVYEHMHKEVFMS